MAEVALVSHDALPPLTMRGEAWRTFLGTRIGPVGVGIVVVVGLMALIHPILLATVWPSSIYDPEKGFDAVFADKTVVLVVADPATEIELGEAKLRQGPFVDAADVISLPSDPPVSLDHPLGVDPFGRDILSMLLGGARPTFFVAVGAAIATFVSGLAAASIAAYYRGAFGTIQGHIANVLLLLPAPLFMIILGTSPISESIGPLTFGAIYGLIFGLSSVAIVLRSHALSVLQRPFFDAARVAGGGAASIITRHLLPHLMPLATILMFVGVTGAIVAHAFVSFTAYATTRFTWGTMIFNAIRFPSPGLGEIPWTVLITAAVAISVFAASFYMIAVGLRVTTETDSGGAVR